MEYPEDLKYTNEHEWAALEDAGTVRVGITDFAQDALGDVVFVDLPDEGAEVRASEAMGEVESTKSVSEIFSPVSGKILQRNPGLEKQPELVNEDPYGDGWMVLIELSDPAEIDDLMDAAAYRRSVESGDD